MAYTTSQAPASEPPSETSPLLSSTTTLNDTLVHPSPSDTHSHTSAPTTNDASPSLSTPHLLRIMSTTWLGVFLAALDSTILATLTAPISTSFHSFSSLSYLATAYLIANAACQPLSGKLTDLFSRKTGLLVSNLFFLVGTLICGVAPNVNIIILGRVVAGVGGGGLTCIATYITSDLVPLRKRGLWQGYGNLVFGAGMGLGGVFGGYLADRLSWRWAFLLQVPFIALSGILVYFLVDIPGPASAPVTVPSPSSGDEHEHDETDEPNHHDGILNQHNHHKPNNAPTPLSRVDFLGSSLLVASLVLLLLGLNTGGNQLPWSSPLIILSLTLALLTLAIFIYVESHPRWVPEPILPVLLIARTRTVLAACLANWFGTMAAFLAIYYVPLYLQIRGLSATEAGMRIVPLAVATSLGSLGSGYLMRATGRYYLQTMGIMMLFVLGCALIVTFELSTPAWETYVFPTPLGFAYGGMLTVTLVGMISAVDHQHQAVITAASYAFRSMGSTIGITIAGAVFQNILTAELRAEYGGMPGSEDVIRRIRDSLDGIKHLPEGWDASVVLGVYMHALRGAFASGLGLAVLAAVAAVGMKEHVLHGNLARN